MRREGEFSVLPGEAVDPEKIKKANARLKQARQETPEAEKEKQGEEVAKLLPPEAKPENRTHPPMP